MWNQVEGLYRGQATSGVILTIDEDAMNKAVRNAGNAVFDTEWWVETLRDILEHWGLKSKRWTDPVTQMPIVHFRLTNERPPLTNTGPFNGAGNTGPMKGTGPLTTRLLNSGKLNSSPLDSGKLNSGKLRDDHR
jgi:hypothetical protein